MMNSQEIQEQLQDNQEATVRIEERVTQLENKELQFPEIKDYDQQFNELKKLIEKHAIVGTNTFTQPGVHFPGAAGAGLAAGA